MENKTSYKTTSLDDIMSALPEDRVARINKRAQQEVAEYMALSDIRKDLDVTQVDIAKDMGVNQVSISKLENRSDIKLSTLRNYLHALGGELVISARFPDKELTTIKSLSD